MSLVIVLFSGHRALAEEASLADSPKPRVLVNFAKLPLPFEANQGQTDKRVKFLAHGTGYVLFLTSKEAVLKLNEGGNAGGVRKQAAEAVGARDHLAQPGAKQLHQSPKSVVLRMALVGANRDAKVSAAEELPGKSNYFIGNDLKQWRTKIPNHGKVRYEGIYPGTDLLYYGKQGQLEFDWILAPGADPAAIKLQLEGADSMELTAVGDLVVRAGGEQIQFNKPVVYQEIKGRRQTIAGRYSLQGRTRIGFQIAAYDHSKPLTIDPTVAYSTYLGGSGLDQGNGIAVDGSGNVYVTGQTASTNFPTTNAFQSAYAGGNSDAFVTKLNAAGSAVVYSTYLGGSGSDLGNAIAVDSSGNVYVRGKSVPPISPQRTLSSQLSAAVATTPS